MRSVYRVYREMDINRVEKKIQLETKKKNGFPTKSRNTYHLRLQK